MNKYVSYFKRDRKPFVELARNMLKQVIIIGDIIVPILESKLVDEVRFYSKEIVFVRDGEMYDFFYKEVRAEVYHSLNKKAGKEPFVKVRFVTDSGDIFQIELAEESTKLHTASFSEHSRDFLFQIASKFPRIREKRFHRKSYFVELFCVASIMAIVLVN